MWLYDFNSWYQGGRAVLAGLSPYSIPTFNGPYFLAMLYAPFTILPEGVVYALFLCVNIFLLWRLCGKRSIWALLSFPILFTLFVGQNDLLIALLTLIGLPWTLPIALCKPQVGFVVLPWLVRRMKKKDLFIATSLGVCIIGLSFILRPTWLYEWLAPKPSVEAYSVHASNVYWLIPYQFSQIRTMATIVFSILCIPIGFFLKERQDSWTWMQLFAPLTNIYSVAVLFEWIGPIEMVLSWLVAFIVKGNIHSGMPMFVIGFSILARRYLEIMKKADQGSVKGSILLKSLFN